MVTIKVENLIDFVADVFAHAESSPEEARRIATYLTTANKLTTSLKQGKQGQMVRLKPSIPAQSAIYFRMGQRLRSSESLQMPPYGTDAVDVDGRATVAAWISALSP